MAGRARRTRRRRGMERGQRLIDDALALQPDRAAWRRRISALSMLGMESLALFVLGNLLAAPSRSRGPSFVTLLAAALLGYGLVRLLQHFDVSRRVLIGTGIAVSCLVLWLLGTLQYSDGLFVDSGLVLLFSDPGRAIGQHAAAALGLLVILGAWLRGAAGGARPRLTKRAVLGSLTAGLAVILLGLTFGQGGPAAQGTDTAALAFFVCGLLTLALLQLGLSEHIHGDSWRGPWLLVLLGTCIVLAAAGASVGLLPLAALNPLFAAAGNLLLLVVAVLLYILVYPIALAATWLLVHLLLPHVHPTNAQIQLPPPPNPRQLQHAHHQTAAGAVVLALGHVLVFVAIVVPVLLVLLWLFRRLEHEPQAEGAERERLEVDSSLAADVRGLLGSLLRRRHAAPGAAEPDLSPRLRELRRIYLDVLRRGQARGIRRQPAETAREHVPQLERAFASELPLQLTEEFVRGRYGRIEPSPEELRRLREGAERLH